MSSQRDSAIIALLVSATVNAFRFVTLNAANTVAQSTAGQVPVGVSQDLGTYDSAYVTNVPVKLFGQGGTFKITMSGAVSVGGSIYVDAAGKGTATPNSGGAVAIANEAATADNDIIEAVWKTSQTGDVIAIGYTVTAADVTATFKDIDTGLGARPTAAIVQVSSAAGALRVRTAAWTLGVCRVTPTGITAGDFIEILYRV